MSQSIEEQAQLTIKQLREAAAYLQAGYTSQRASEVSAVYLRTATLIETLLQQLHDAQ